VGFYEEGNEAGAACVAGRCWRLAFRSLGGVGGDGVRWIFTGYVLGGKRDSYFMKGRGEEGKERVLGVRTLGYGNQV